jgi:hypothetical protein
MWVLARANDTMARQIPPDVFIEMLNSGIWTDRNKGTIVLERLTANRNPVGAGETEDHGARFANRE